MSEAAEQANPNKRSGIWSLNDKWAVVWVVLAGLGILTFGTGIGTYLMLKATWYIRYEQWAVSTKKRRLCRALQIVPIVGCGVAVIYFIVHYGLFAPIQGRNAGLWLTSRSAHRAGDIGVAAMFAIITPLVLLQIEVLALPAMFARKNIPLVALLSIIPTLLIGVGPSEVFLHQMRSEMFTELRAQKAYVESHPVKPHEDVLAWERGFMTASGVPASIPLGFEPTIAPRS
jgi:hypothetical protein